MNKKQVLSVALTLMLFAPAVSLAANEPRGFSEPSNFKGVEDADTSLFETIVNIVNALLAFAGLVAAIFMVIGGVRYITSQGDEDATAGAKNTILYAAVGIIVILLSAVLVNFVINSINP